jgi:hypothetical protein
MISYKLAYIQANKILDKMLDFPDKYEEIYDEYLDYIKKCGWSDEEFNKQLMKDIDSSWEC